MDGTGLEHHRFNFLVVGKAMIVNTKNKKGGHNNTSSLPVIPWGPVSYWEMFLVPI